MLIGREKEIASQMGSTTIFVGKDQVLHEKTVLHS